MWGSESRWVLPYNTQVQFKITAAAAPTTFQAPRLSIQTFVPYPPLRLVPWGKGGANLVTGGFFRFHVLRHEYCVLPTPTIRQPHMPLPTVQENRINDRQKERYRSIY